MAEVTARIPTDRHPIEQTLIDALGEVDGALGFDEEGRAAIEAGLRARFGHPDLRDAVAEVVLFAFFLEVKKGARAAADALIALVQIARTPLEAQGLGLESVIGSAAVESRAKALLGSHRDLTPVANKEKVAGAKSWWELRGGSDEKRKQ